MAAIAAGFLVSISALVAALLLAHSGPAGRNVVVGSGANPAPASSLPSPTGGFVAPETPPVVMGDHQAGLPSGFYVRAADQVGDGRSVIVEDASLARQAGWIVIHDASTGAAGTIIGVSQLQPAGDHTDVKVTLTSTVSRSTYLFVMLHSEDNGDASFDYPGADQPAQANGQIVMVQIYLKLQQ